MTDAVEITLHQTLTEIGQADWDACAAPECADGGRAFDPFTTYRFIKALEESGSVGGQSGWDPHYIAVHKAGQIIACAPLYLKYHSQGEYIFDHSWAHAYENAGGSYYPKLQVAVPFTPVTGRRLLTQPDQQNVGRVGLLQGMAQVAEKAGLSGVHVNFCTADEAQFGEALGYMTRLGQQFHWLNDGFADFDGFLAQLSSRKRKTIRKERLQAQGFGGRIEVVTGAEITPAHWDAMWWFYQDTGARKWGSPYLTRSFFDLAHEHLRDDVVLVMAHRDGRYVAGAMNVLGREALFGRYWGCIEDHPCLHFELCYYQAVDYAISKGLRRVEAGAQGEHKLARGYLPTSIYSMHWFQDQGFSQAVNKYLVAERNAVESDIDILTEYGPFKKSHVEDHQ